MGKRNAIRSVLSFFSFLLIFSGTYGQFSEATLRPQQEARINNISIQNGIVQQGIQGILVRFDCEFKYALAEAKSLKLKDNGSYLFTASLYYDDGLPVHAVPDSRVFQGKKGYLQDSMAFTLQDSLRSYENLDFFLPYFAADLPEGNHKLQLRLALVDRNTRTGLNAPPLSELSSELFEYQKPRNRLFRFDVVSIKVKDKDENNAVWDYGIFNPKDTLADIEWLLRRGNSYVANPRRQKNVQEYRGGGEDVTSYFSLSEGDILSLQVRDFDFIGVSDNIGTIDINPWQAGYPFGEIQKLSFEGVTEARLRMQLLSLPKLNVSNLKVSSPAIFEGITGVSVSFYYQAGELPKRGAFSLDILQNRGLQSILPENGTIVEGDAALDENGHLLLSGSGGKVNVFYPHYGLRDEWKGKLVNLRFVAQTSIDRKAYTISRQKREVELPLEAKDFELNGVSFTETTREGLTGIQIDWNYKLSRAYFRSLPTAIYSLFPRFYTGSGLIPDSAFTFISPQGLEFSNGQIILDSTHNQGKVSMFVPIQYLHSSDLAALTLRTVIEGKMVEGDRTLPIGFLEETQQVALPEVHELQFRVSEVISKKFRWMVNGPNLRWKLYQGSSLLHESPFMGTERNPQWGPDQMVPLQVCETDEILIEIVHLEKGEESLIGIWRGSINDLPGRGDGKGWIKMEGLRKCKVEGQKI